MKLDFVLGSTTIESLDASLNDIINKAKDVNNNILVLVPETNSAMVERLLLEKNPALINVEVLSFARLLSKINSNIGKNFLSRDNAILVIKKIIIDNQENLVCFKKSAKSAGFATIIYDTISQFKASQISPDDVEEMINYVPTTLKIKLQDLHLIYSKYQEFLLSNFLDSCDKLSYLINGVAKSDKIKNSFVYIVGFSSLTSQALSLIEELAEHSKGVKVGCSYVQNLNAINFENEVFEKVKQLADKHNVRYNPQLIKITKQQEFNHLEKNLFAYPFNVSQNTGRIEIKSALNVYDEVNFIARKISNALKQGVKPSEISIFCPNPSEYARNFDEIFFDYDLPFFINKTEMLSNHPLFNYILSALALIKHNFDTEQVLNFVSNVFFDAENINDFVNYVNKFAISHNAFFNPFSLGEKNKQEKNNAEQIRQQFVQTIMPFKNKTKICETTKDYITLIMDFLDEINVKNKLQKLYENELKLDIFKAKVTEQVLDKITSFLDSVNAFLGDTVSTLDEFLQLFELVGGVGKISVIPPTLGTILITDEASLISPRTKMLIISGVTDNVVPFKTDDCGLIVDSDLGALSEIVQKKIEPTIRTVNRREKQKVYELVITPKEKLILTYPQMGLNGEENSPSNLIDAITKLFDKMPEIAIDPVFSKRKMIKTMMKGLYDENQREFNSLVYYALKTDIDAKMLRNLNNINLIGNVENITLAENLYFKKHTVSISELEKYFACPMAHFVTYGLRLKEKIDGTVQALDVGNILHLFAEKFVKNIDSFVNVDLERQAKKLLNECLKELEIPEEKNALVLSIVKEEAVRLAGVLLSEKTETSFKSVAQELSFGYTDAPVVFNNNIRLVGKIDRVDIWNNYIKIVDYKTGNVSVDPADVYFGRKMQLISYLLALKNYKNTQMGAVLYFPIHNDFAKSEDQSLNSYKTSGLILNDFNVVKALDNAISIENPKSHRINVELYSNKEVRETGEMLLKRSQDLVDCKTVDNLCQYVYTLINNAIGEILNGVIVPSPTIYAGKMPCCYCPLKNVCGLEHLKENTIRELNAKISYEQIASVVGGEENETHC